MILKQTFINNAPVPPGVCTRCAGYKPSYRNTCCVTQQHSGGEVRDVTCARCKGTGVEPKTFWERLKAAFSVEPIEV